MAKGRQRSNREIRKPKQKKTAIKPETTFTDQVKTTAKIPIGKGKS